MNYVLQMSILLQFKQKLEAHVADCVEMNDCAIRLLSKDDKWRTFSYMYQHHWVFSIFKKITIIKKEKKCNEFMHCLE